MFSLPIFTPAARLSSAIAAKNYRDAAELLKSMPNLVKMALPPSLPPFLCQAVNEEDCKMVELLLKNGADPSILHPWGIPLHHATFNKNIEIMRLLIASGANPNQANEKGYTPLHVAMSLEEFDESVTLLIASGARMDSTNEENQTPMQLFPEALHAEVLQFHAEEKKKQSGLLYDKSIILMTELFLSSTGQACSEITKLSFDILCKILYLDTEKGTSAHPEFPILDIADLFAIKSKVIADAKAYVDGIIWKEWKGNGGSTAILPYQASFLPSFSFSTKAMADAPSTTERSTCFKSVCK